MARKLLSCTLLVTLLSAPSKASEVSFSNYHCILQLTEES